MTTDNGRRTTTNTRRVKNERRVAPGGKRKGDDAAHQKKAKLIEALRQQARTRRAANAVMRVEPTKLESFLEWQAADMLENS